MNFNDVMQFVFNVIGLLAALAYRHWMITLILIIIFLILRYQKKRSKV